MSAVYSPPWHEIRTSMAASSRRSLASLTEGVRLPISGAAAPAWDVEKKTGSTRSKSRSSRMRCTRTEPTMPRQPMMPTFIYPLYRGFGRCRGAARVALTTAVSSHDRPRARHASPLRKYLLRNRLELQIGRAFIDLPDLGVAIQLLDRVVLDESISAKQVHRERRHAFRHFRGEQLAHGCLAQERAAGVAQTRGVVDQQPRRLEFGGRARDPELPPLKVA